MKIYTKKNRAYLILLVSAYIFICLLRIDKNVFSYPEFENHSHQTYTELIVDYNAPQLHSKTIRPVSVKLFSSYKKVFTEKSIRYCAYEHCEMCAAVQLIEQTKEFSQITNIISVLHKKNICHKSSEDDIAVS